MRYLKLSWPFVTILLVTTVAFWPVFSSDFVNLDDPKLVLENPVVRSDSLWVFLDRIIARDYLPLTFFSYAIEYRLFGFDPFYFHLNNLVLHILNSILIFLLMQSLFSLRVVPSLIVAMLFSLHPTHVESVAWISERKDVLSSFFFLLCFWLYGKYLKRPSIALYLMVFVTFFGCLMSKAMGVSLPVIMVIYDGYRNWQSGRRMFQLRQLIEKIPLFILSIIFSLIHFKLRTENSESGFVVYSPVEAIENALQSFAFYLNKIFIPINLAAYYEAGAVSLSHIEYLFAGCMVALGSFAIWKFRRTGEVWFGVLFFVITLVPVLRLIPIGNDFIFADRFLYIPSIGMFLSIVALGDRLKGGTLRRLMGTVSFAVIFVFLILTHRQAQVWQNSETLWKDVLSKYPKSKIAHTNLGVLYYQLGKIEAAAEEYEKALAIDGKYLLALNNLGNLYREKNEFGKAKEYYFRVLEVDSLDSDARNSLGFIYQINGEIEKATQEYLQALKKEPYHSMANGNLAIAYFQTGKKQEALKLMTLQVKINPLDPITRTNLGVMYLDQGAVDLAKAEFLSALKLNPNFEKAKAGLERVSVFQNETK